PGGEQHARTVKDDRYVEALADQAGGGEQVDQRYRTLKRDGMDEHEGFLTWFGPDVLEDLLLSVVQRVDAGLAARRLNGDRHGASCQLFERTGEASRAKWPARAGAASLSRSCGDSRACPA